MDLALIDATTAPASASFLSPSFCEFSSAYDVLKWAAILVSSFALATLIARLRFFLLGRNSPILQPLHGKFVDFDDFTDDDDASSVGDLSLSDYDDGSEEEEEEEEEERDSSSSHRWGHDFSVSDSGLRRRRSFAENLSQLYSGRSVVRLWDNIGSRFRSISLADCGGVDFPVIRPTSPGILVSAGLNEVRNIALSAWDGRVGFRVPAILAEWSPGERYPMVGDVRNVSRPLAEEEMDSWWDADAVNDDGED
ncbi:hypothetical protein MLD38_007523 [Melastoma candidum]|uniref:Uncharacterized protein n=1 Tax=Melastoma candidum TaxID=119954 RepID=A0ACB9RVP0_9MYRT|nr:hypothetical protein MLD38_007523 [Melastoma candidum]